MSRTHRQTDNILTPWAPVGAKNNLSSSPHFIQNSGNFEDNDCDHYEHTDGGQDARSLGVLEGAALQAVGGAGVDLLNVPGAVHTRPERKVRGGF